MKTYKILILAIFGVVATGCNNEPSLQEYYVENQEDKKFIAIDLPTSLLTNNESLNEQQLKTLESVKKINVLAYPIQAIDTTGYGAEKEELNRILKDDKYQLLMKFGSGDRKVEIFFTGEEDAIDEFVVYGLDEQRGMGVARVLGNDMDPEELIKLVKSLEKGDIDMNGLQGLASMFTEQNKK